MRKKIVQRVEVRDAAGVQRHQGASVDAAVEFAIALHRAGERDLIILVDGEIVMELV